MFRYIEFLKPLLLKMDIDHSHVLKVSGQVGL